MEYKFLFSVPRVSPRTVTFSPVICIVAGWSHRLFLVWLNCSRIDHAPLLAARQSINCGRIGFVVSLGDTRIFVGRLSVGCAHGSAKPLLGDVCLTPSRDSAFPGAEQRLSVAHPSAWFFVRSFSSFPNSFSQHRSVFLPDTFCIRLWLCLWLGRG